MGVISGMAAEDLSARIRGIIPAIPTPLTREYEPDLPALRNIVRHVLAGGVHGLWVLGTGGEFPALDENQRQAVITTVVEEARGRVPVVAGTGHACTDMALRAARIAADAGADALFAIPPFYYFYEEQEIVQHVRAIARETPLPAILYNNPFNTKLGLSIGAVSVLSREADFIAVKDSTLNFDSFQALLRVVPRDGTFKMLQGDEMSLAAGLLMGADGAVMALPNIAPQLCVNLYDAVQAGEVKRARELQNDAASLFEIFSLPGRSGDSAFLAGQKAALEVMGLCERHLSKPFAPLRDEELEPIRGILERHDLLPASRHARV
jgi:4-hydroxy-tetrahydrodipicolinate synthase